MKTHEMSLAGCEKLMQKYFDKGGEIFEVSEGVLGLGTIILSATEGLKCFVIEEYFLNSWSSGHRVKEYKNYSELPKKYKKMIEVLYENI